MTTIQAIQKMSLLFLVAVFLLASCESIDQIHIDDPYIVASRSCKTVTQSWIDQLKILAAEDYAIPVNDIEVSAIEKLTDTTFVYHSHSTLESRPANDITKFLLLVTHDGFDGDIIGYYDSTSLSFCTSPDASYIIKGSLDEITEATLGIIGVDQDIF